MKSFTALALVAVFLTGCGKSEEVKAEPPPTPKEAISGEVVLTPEAAITAGIVVQIPQIISIQTQLNVPGVVETTPGGRSVVTPPVAGRILRLLVSVGDPVTEGQPLAILESVDLAERATAVTEARRGVQAAQSEVARAMSERTLAVARQRTADQTLRRQRELARAGAFSQPSLQAAQRELSDATAALESAQREAAVHRAQLERSERLFRQELVSKIEVENARLDVEKDRIAQERATREIAIARATFERERLIGSKGLLNAREVQAAEAETRAATLEIGRANIALRAAQDAVAGARSALASAQSAYAALKGNRNLAEGGRLTIVAPMGGRVVHREVGLGQAVERATELFEIDDLRSVIVVAQVPERDIARVRAGSSVSVTTDAFPGRTFAGTVATVGGRLDPKTRSLPVQVLVPNGDGSLRPEMFAQVGLGTGAKGTVLTVPNSALFEAEGKHSVFVEQTPGTYVRKVVKVGRNQGGLVEILSGLTPDVRVVVEGVFTLKSQSRSDELKGEE